jgi:uncharacterized protein (DUF1015 family)
MVKIRKFRGYLANKENVEKIISPPYDVCSVKEAREDAGDNEMYYYHVNKPAIDLADGATVDEIALKGKENLQNFIEKGYLVRDDEERVYVYSQQLGDHVQYGVMCLSSIDDYENNLIKKHEHTLPEMEAERTLLCDVQGGNAGPVFFSYMGGDSITNRMIEIAKSEPYAQLQTEDKVTHTLWKCNKEDSDFIVGDFENIDCTYIADGHHRSAAAYNVGKLRRQRAVDAGIEVTGDEPFNYFMTVIFPAEQCKILDYNRLLNTLNEKSEDEFIESLGKNYTISEITDANPRPQSNGHVSMYIKDKWFDLVIKEEFKSEDPAKNLDYQILTDYCFTGVMGIENIKKDPRVEFIGGGRGYEYLMKRCHDDCKAAFLMYPVSMEELFAVADAGAVMPPKCTWFEPKLRSGFVVNVFEDSH